MGVKKSHMQLKKRPWKGKTHIGLLEIEGRKLTIFLTLIGRFCRALRGDTKGGLCLKRRWYLSELLKRKDWGLREKVVWKEIELCVCVFSGSCIWFFFFLNNVLH